MLSDWKSRCQSWNFYNLTCKQIFKICSPDKFNFDFSGNKGLFILKPISWSYLTKAYHISLNWDHKHKSLVTRPGQASTKIEIANIWDFCPFSRDLTSTILTDEGKELMWADESRRLTKRDWDLKWGSDCGWYCQVHGSLVASKSHKCKCHAALELLEFNSSNDVSLYKGCMAKTIRFAW